MELKIPDKKTRHKIYFMAKRIYIDDLAMTSPEEHYGMCSALMAAYLGVVDKHANYMELRENMGRIFPEFSALKPEYKTFGRFWWPREDTDTRIVMFNKIIEETYK